MSENYSRRNHSSKEEKKSAPNVTEHVTKGFTAFQKSPYCRRDNFVNHRGFNHHHEFHSL